MTRGRRGRGPMGRMAMETFDVTLRRLTVGDDELLGAVLAGGPAGAAISHLDGKTHALVRIGALVALDAAPQSYARYADEARAAGASPDEIVGTLIASIPIVGNARALSAAPRLALALGYDIEAALEERTEEAHDG